LQKWFLYVAVFMFLSAGLLVPSVRVPLAKVSAITVPHDFATIQAAVDDADEGGTLF